MMGQEEGDQEKGGWTLSPGCRHEQTLVETKAYLGALRSCTGSQRTE